jgi:hypothetical protein
MADLGATNTLSVVRFVDALTLNEQAAWAMWLVTTRAQVELSRLGRRYADGLLKFEPGDIAALPIEQPQIIRGALHRLQAGCSTSARWQNLRVALDRG